MRSTSRLAITAAGVIAVAASAFAASAVVVRFDPDKPNTKSATIWLGYLMARTVFHEKHGLPMPVSGEIIPTFEEEVDARTAASQIYRELKEKDAKLKDPYWETLLEVRGHGFMGAYVWTFLRRKQWPAMARPANLAAFEEWKRRALPNHKVQTYGWLEAGKP